MLRDSFRQTDQLLILIPLGDKVALLGAARLSAELGTNAFGSPRSFGRGRAALSNV